MAEYPVRRRKLWFGDGTEGVIYKESIQISPKGEEWVVLWIKPTQSMKDYWDIKDSQLDQNGLIRRMYKKSMMKVLNPDPIVGTVLIKCSFKWHDTELTMEDKNILAISALQTQNKILRERVAILEVDLQRSLTRMEEYAKRFNRVRKEMGGRDSMSPEMEEMMMQQGGG